MKLPTVPTKAVVEHLNTTYFKQSWNAPDDNGRINFQLYKAATRLQTGAVPVDLSVVGLPTTDKVYAVYRVSYRVFGRFITLPPDKWITDKKVWQEYGTAFTVYTSSGRVIAPGTIRFRYLPEKGQVLVVIDRVMTSGCTDLAYPELYMTIVRDTTRATPTTGSTFVVNSNSQLGTPATTVMAAINAAKANYPASTILTINGWAWDLNHVPVLGNNDIVSIVSDPDVIGYVDITVDDNQTGYYSTHYNEYRELLHIPKSLNPNNIILTTELLNTVVFDSVTKRGVLGHRVSSHALESVTHNDFSMGRTAIEDFSESLNANNVFVRLYIRYSTKPNYLAEDANHIKDLYSLSDLEILKQLLGLATKQIPEWKALNLEQSTFLPLLYKFHGFDTSNALTNYVTAMGYYDVASVLGQQMRFYTYKGAQVEVIKPVRLNGYPCSVIAYCNGVKISEDNVGVSDYKSNSFLLGFKSQALINIGDRIGLYIVERDYRTAIPFNPTAAAPGIILDNEDYAMYRKYTYSDPQTVSGGTVTKGYEPIPYGPADYKVTLQSNGKYLYKAATKNLDRNFIFIPKYGVNTLQYDLSGMITSGQPITVKLTTTDIDNVVLPLLGYASMEVYLNGYRLIEKMDYVVSPVLGTNGDILQNLLVISNYDYLNLEIGRNQLEVVVHGDITVSEDKGYAVENMLHRSALPLIWTRSSSRTFVHGQLQETVRESGNIVITGNNVENGAPFLMQYMLSYGAAKLLDGINPNLDINLRTRIERVLGVVNPSYPDTVLISHLYAIYSPFLAQVTHDVGLGMFKITGEVKDDMFLKQFKKYQYLIDRDPVIESNGLIDRRFVSLAAHYVNFAVSDSEQMIRMQRLVSLVLTPGDLSIKDVLI